MPPSEHQAIDWEAVYKSLDWDSRERREDEESRRLELRAQQYAQSLDQAVQNASVETLTALTFRLGSDRYAVPVMAVHGVRQVRKIVRVPGVPRFYRGVVNVRGEIITVLDLRLLFDASANVPANDDSARELVVVQARNLEIGLLAVHVEGVMAIPRAALHPVEDVRYVLGVTAERLILLDIERLLGDRRLIVQNDGSRGE
jgi:purine-binding chemotaxis protein CheW